MGKTEFHLFSFQIYNSSWHSSASLQSCKSVLARGKKNPTHFSFASFSTNSLSTRYFHRLPFLKYQDLGSTDLATLDLNCCFKLQPGQLVQPQGRLWRHLEAMLLSTLISLCFCVSLFLMARKVRGGIFFFYQKWSFLWGDTTKMSFSKWLLLLTPPAQGRGKLAPI